MTPTTRHSPTRRARRFPRRTGLAAVALAVATACATNPATGEREFSLVSEQQEIQLGQQAAQQVEQTMAFVDDAALQAYVARLGTQLARASERPDLPWTFRVVDDPTPNAFALPGGYIYLTRGMLNLMDSEAELATVLGHEIAHVTARHSAQALTRQQFATLGVGLGGILFPELEPFGQIANAGLDLLFLKYGRGAERQADDLGFRYALEAGYDVNEMADVFESLRRFSGLEQRSALPSWLATHPGEEERIAAVRARIEALPSPQANPRLGRAEYLGQIDGLPYGDNPRNGFFRDGVYYHPDLRFRFSIPADWQTQNLARAVLALSPERNASVQLTLAAQGLSGAQALQQFLGQQGIQAGSAAQQSVNGIPAALATFQAQTQGGTITGIVAFLEYRGLTYQFLTYSTPQVYAANEAFFRQVIGSFAPLTDPAILGIRPAEIDIVRLPRAMSLAEFARAYPSVLPVEQLAILNQVTQVNDVLAAGTLVKRVVAGG